MFDKFVARLVTNYLGKYFENVNKEQVKVSLWSGHVQLKNLRFRKDFLRAFDTAICLKEGVIDELTIVIPWRRLNSQCVVVTIKKLCVVLQQKIAVGYDLECEKREAYERKKQQLKVFEAVFRQECLEENVHANFADDNVDGSVGKLKESEIPVEERKDAAFAARIKAVILNNIQLVVQDVVVTYEGCQFSGEACDGVSRKQHQCNNYQNSVSVMIDHFRTHSCDENNNLFFAAAGERVLYKKALLEGLQVVLNASSEGGFFTKKANNVEELAKGCVCGSNIEKEHSDKSATVNDDIKPPPRCRTLHMSSYHVVAPFNAVALVQYQPVPYRTDLPMMHINVHIDTLRAKQSCETWEIFHSLWREVRDGERYEALLRFRPVGAGKERPTDDARAWWVYAINATLHRIRRLRKQHVFVWETYKQQKAAREEYMLLFRRAQCKAFKATWLKELNEEEQLRLDELEMELPIESIKLARRLVYNRLLIEQEHKNKLFEKWREQQQQQQDEEEEEKKENKGEKKKHINCFGKATGTCTTGRGTSMMEAEDTGWWSWWNGIFSARVWSGQEITNEVFEENDLEGLEDIDNALQLIYADRWTAAQRLSIAKEFGISDQEVENLSEVGGKAQGSVSEVRWKISFDVHLLGLTLCESNLEGAPFASLEITKLSLGLTCAISWCFTFSLDADDYILFSHLESCPHAISILRAAKKRYLPDEAAVSLLLKRTFPYSLTQYDITRNKKMPFELCLKCNPMDCNLEMGFLQACVDFFERHLQSSFLLTMPSVQPMRESKSSIMDLNARRMGLMVAVEKAFLCDWQMLFCGIRLVVAENEELASRITLEHLEVSNDLVKTREKWLRIQKHAEKAVVFGDDPDDWVTTINVTAEGAAADCTTMRVNSDGVACDTSYILKKHWDRIVDIPHFTLCFKKSIMMRCCPFVPFFSLFFMLKQPLRCRLLRESLFVFCTSLTSITNLFQRCSQHAVISQSMTPKSLSTKTTTAPALAASCVVFFAQVRDVGERYLVDHEPLPDSSEKQFFRTKLRESEVAGPRSRIEVVMGKMIVYHALQQFFPSHFFELHSGHLHTNYDTDEVSVFIERGGVPHHCRNGVLQAKRLLVEKYKFPLLDSMTLFEAFIEEWCKTQQGGFEAEEEVRQAFSIILTASRTNPCFHICLKFETSMEAQRFISTLNTHSVSYHSIDSPIDMTVVEKETKEMEETKEGVMVETDEKPCLFTLNITTPECLFLLYDEAIQESNQCDMHLSHEVAMKTVNFLCEMREKTIFVSIAASSLLVMADGRNVPVINVSGSDGNSSVINGMFQMKFRPYPNFAWKCTKIAILKDIEVEFSSELVCVFEMLWDIVEIVSIQVFTRSLHRSIPWTYEPAAVVEEKWRADSAGGLLQGNLILIDIDRVALSIYYPSDEFDVKDRETAKTAPFFFFTVLPFSEFVDVRRERVAVIDARKVSLCFNCTDGCTETSVAMQHPQIKMRQSPFGCLCRLVGSEENSDVFTQSPRVFFSYSIHRKPPMISFSDFLANGGGPTGYRYSHFLKLFGANLDVVFWQPQMWYFIELLTRGVVSRAGLLTWRQPYVIGSSLLRWPQQDVPVEPFSWCLLHKDIELSNLQLTLPHEVFFESTRLWGKVNLFLLKDKLVFVKKQEQQNRQDYCVKHILSMNLNGFEVFSVCHKRRTVAPVTEAETLLKRTNVLFESSFELFSAAGWPNGRLRCFSIHIPDDIIFQGSSYQLALFIDWFYANYMEQPWNGYFLPKVVRLDPFFMAYGGGESTAWFANVNSVRIRLHDPLQLYHCVKEYGGSFYTVEHDPIDIDIVVKRLLVELHWKSDGTFLSCYDIGEASVWSAGQNSHNNVFSRSKVGKTCDTPFLFFWLHHADADSLAAQQTERQEESCRVQNNETSSSFYSHEPVAFRATYNVIVENGKKAVFGNVTVSCIDITPVPSFLYSIKDSLFSLHIRNALGRILRWEQKVPGVFLKPPCPESLDFSSNYCMSLHLLNLTVPSFLRPYKPAVVLFFASIMSTEFVFFADKNEVGRKWSISVDRILDNGIVASSDDTSGIGRKLRPLLVHHICSKKGGTTAEEDRKKLIYIAESETNGIEGTISSLRIILPPKNEIYTIRDVLEKEGYKELFWLGTFFEERWALRNQTICNQVDKRPLSIHLSIESPSVLLAEHGLHDAESSESSYGLVCSLEKITAIKTADECKNFSVAFSALCVKTLGDNLHEVIKPTGLVVSGFLRSDRTREVSVRIDALIVQVEESLYEFVLHCIVRHFVATDMELLEVMYADGEEFVPRSSLPLGDVKMEEKKDENKFIQVGTCENEKTNHKKNGDLCVHIEWESFIVRMIRDGISFFFAVGSMSFLCNAFSADGTLENIVYLTKQIQANVDFVTLGVDDRPHIFDLQPVVTDFSASNTENKFSEEISTALPLPRPRLSFSLYAQGNSEEEVHINLGKLSLFLEENTVRLLFSTFYEPYKRIVMREYQIQEIRRIDSDITLQEKLVLSRRTKLQVLQGRYNHITINGNGNDIHFIDSGSPLLFLKEGLTLYIASARVHLYGKPIEYYMVAGNGSYVVIDKSCVMVTHGLRNLSRAVGPTDSTPQQSTWDLKIGSGEGEGGEPTFDNKGLVRTDKEFSGSSDLTRRMFANALLVLTLPERLGESQLTRSRHKPQHAHFSRSLVLTAKIFAQMEKVQNSSDIKSLDEFNLSDFTLRCEYLDAAGNVVGARPLVSPWALTVHHTTFSLAPCQQSRYPLRRCVEVKCSCGIEVCLRYSVVSLCWHAFLSARQALGHIEKNVFDDLTCDEEFQVLEILQQQYSVEDGGKNVKWKENASVSFSLQYISVDFVDDSANSVDVPLFRTRIQNITLPTAVKDGLTLKVHLSCSWNIIYYDFTSSSWRPLLEPVFLDIVLRKRPNVSLEDVKLRRGLLRAGVHFRAMRVHFSSRVAENMRRLWMLKGRLDNDALLLLQHDGSSKPKGTFKRQFFMYKLTQHIGGELKISFSLNSDFYSNCQPFVLRLHEPVQINFPRVEGHELPLSQHCLKVSNRQNTTLVNVAKTGRSILSLGTSVLNRNVLVDITVSDKQKIVNFRTNVTFKNDLPFAMNVDGVGDIRPGEVLHVPIDSLRRRTSFVPLTENLFAASCSLGVTYDMLPYFYNQVFLGACLLDHSNTTMSADFFYSTGPVDRSVYFLLRFAPESRIGKSDVLDCVVTFEAPFFIVNSTRLPMRVGLMYRRKLMKKSSLFNLPDFGAFDHIATLDAAPGERCSVTQVSPLMDIYIDVSITQANGELLSQNSVSAGGTRTPALVHSTGKLERDRTIMLCDNSGTSLILHIDYTSCVVTIWCPYWFVNKTPYYLKIADRRKGKLVAGLLEDEGIPPHDESCHNHKTNCSFAYILNSERMEKLGSKSVVFICIGRRSEVSKSDDNDNNNDDNDCANSDGVTRRLEWTGWSDKVLIGAIREFGTFNCALTKNVSISFSYSVEFLGGFQGSTRVVTVSPRWIFENHTQHLIAFRHYKIRKEKEIQSLITPVELAPDQCHIINLVNRDDETNPIQIRLPADSKTGIQSCHWSQPFDINKLSDRAFNLHYAMRSNVEDNGFLFNGDTITNHDNEMYVVQTSSAVFMLSCYRRGSTMYAVLSRRQRPPYVIENRTMYTAYVKQQSAPCMMTIYPRTTRGFAWEDSKLQQVMELWVSEGAGNQSKSVFINFEPQAILKRREQLQQKLFLNGSRIVLFIRVRGLGTTSYAVSITTEKIIDTFCFLPYFQFFFQVEVDSIYTLLSDEKNDLALLTVKPLKLTFSQGAAADGDGDEQVFDFSLCVIQIDDERTCAKQSVVAQLADAKPLTIHFTRKLLRVTPILYFKNFVIKLSPAEVHLEDSFVFAAMKYAEKMRHAFCGVTADSNSGSSDALWMRQEGGSIETKSNTFCGGREPRAEVAWKQQVVFVEHLLIEQFMISTSLYRSPGAQNDPMWGRMKYLSLFVRSVQDARFVWRRIEQYGVYETLWLFGVFYSSYYKHQLQEQMSNVVHVAGLDTMRVFVTDLLQGYFSLSSLPKIHRLKSRAGRRSEACFISDENFLTSMEANANLIDNEFDGKKNNFENADSLLFIADNESMCSLPTRNFMMKAFDSKKKSIVIDAASRLPWSAFYARFSDRELCEYGIFAVERFFRVLGFGDPSQMQWQLQDLVCSAGGDEDAAEGAAGSCRRCEEIEAMRTRRLEMDDPNVLPHPDLGLVTWAEFVHHVSWDEFVRLCTPAEVRRHAGAVVRSLLGQSMNVIRVKSIGSWTVDA